jgi:predicted metal-dependent HD superfamily phosphohydrolase
MKDHFIDSALEFCRDTQTAEKMWREIAECYSSRGRYYHTLDHLDAMLKEILPFRDQFEDWSVVVFAIAYHDAIYNPRKNDNEEKSAALALERLQSIDVPEHVITKCTHLILATKKHDPADHETNLFTDADLSVLGSDRSTYDLYAKNVRREYSMYPDFLYRPGRRKVLQHFLDMERIFKTEEFAGKFEERARVNLERELKELS